MRTKRGIALCCDSVRRSTLSVAVVLLLAMAFGLVACAPAPQDNPVLAVVNGRPITLDEFDFRWAELSESTRSRYKDDGGRKRFLEDLISRILLMQEARKRGIHRSPIVRHRTQRFQERLLLDEVMRQAVQASVEVTDEELEAYYVSHGAVLPAPDQIEISQIVTNNKYAANDLKRLLDEGASFSSLARRYSQDKVTRAKGGEVGLYQKGSAPPEVEEVIYKLRAGRTSKPIKTESGFYLVRVTSRKPGDKDAVVKARERLEQELYAEKRQTQIEAYLSNLKSSASIRMKDASKYVIQQTSALREIPQP